MAAHTFNLSTREAEAVDLCELEASLVDTMSSRTARNTQKNPVLRTKKEGGRGK